MRFLSLTRGFSYDVFRHSACRPLLDRLELPRPIHVRQYTAPAIAGVSEDEIRSARAYCSDFLKRFDAPAYTFQTFIPPHARDAYLSLRAFNIDVARVADATSNPAVGAMRMQFWRDAVTRALSFTPPKEPVAVLLSAASAALASQTEGKNKLSKGWLHRVVNTREQYLHNPPYPDLAAVESYAENTYSTLLYLTLSSLPVTSLTADHLASHIGKAQGIVAVLRGIPLIAFPAPPNKRSNQTLSADSLGSSNHQGSVLLPLDVMVQAGVREDDVLRNGAEAKGLRDAVFTVATRANDHLITAREMLKNLKAGHDVGHEFEHGDEDEHMSGRRDTSSGEQLVDVDRGFGVLVQAVAAQRWLDRLQTSDFDVFEPRLRSSSDWKLPLQAYWAYKRRQF